MLTLVLIFLVQCSCVIKLYDYCFHEWKIIHNKKIFGRRESDFKFYSNPHFESKLLKDFPSFYQQMLMNSKKYFTVSPITPSYVLSQFLWYNSYIKIDSKVVFINFITQLFNTDGSVKNWNILRIITSSVGYNL